MLNQIISLITVSNRWEHPLYPTYFFPEEDLPHFYLSAVESSSQATVYNINAGDKAIRALTRYHQSDLAGLFTIKFSAMDAWFEEDEQIFVHPKDPYKASAHHYKPTIIFTSGELSSGSIFCALRGMLESKWKVVRWPTRRPHTFFSKQDCPFGIIS